MRPLAELFFALLLTAAVDAGSPTPHELQIGFSAAQDSSYTAFQPLLADPTGVFALGFLRVDSTLLSLAVLHLPSSFPVWRSAPRRQLLWSDHLVLAFDGDLKVIDSREPSTVLWSSSAASGTRVVLLGNSDLQVQKLAKQNSTVLWSSFSSPADTIVLDQNLTAPAALLSENRRFSMKLGSNYIALFMEFDGALPMMLPPRMYWKHTALEVKAQILAGHGATYVRIDRDGFLGMYQKEGPPADVLPFDTFNHGLAPAIRRLTLESDGNLRAYYWNGSKWIQDFVAIADRCKLPTTCGAYSVCNSVSCECLMTNSTGQCSSTSVSPGTCERFTAMTRRGVEFADKDLLGSFVKTLSFDNCIAACRQNCSCVAAAYTNATGYCYIANYAAELLVAADESKLGYFKVFDSATTSRHSEHTSKIGAVLLSIGVTLLAIGVAYGCYLVWQKRKRELEMTTSLEEGIVQGKYKNLGSASFKQIELSSDSFRR